MDPQEIKTVMQKYFESPEISARIKGYLKDKNLTYDTIDNDELIKMLEQLSLLNPLLERINSYQDNQAISTVDVSLSKKTMVLKILKGTMMKQMTRLPKDTKFTISVCFMDQRYQTVPLPVSSQPAIGESFQMKFDKSVMDIETSKSIELAVTVWNHDGTRTIYAVKQIEWRFVLAFGSISFDIELAPFIHTGVVETPCVGVLSLILELYPKSKGDLVSQRMLNAQLALEKKQKQTRTTVFYEMSTQFWNDFKSIHNSYGKRTVRIYAENEDKIFIPVSKFVCPLYNVRGVDSPFHALRFVSLIPFEEAELNKKPNYKRFHTFLAKGSGNVQDHCHLLCSLLLGFGMRAYVSLGMSGKGEHAWVMTHDKNSTSEPWTIWEVTTGIRMKTNEERAWRGYRVVSVLYNHETYCANIQLNDSMQATSFKIQDETKWKHLPRREIQGLSLYNQQISFLHPTLNAYEIEEYVEKALIKKIEQYRKQFSQPTRVDQKLSSMLTLALSNYEYERITQNTFGEQEFMSIIKNYIPQNHTFKAFPIQLFERNPEKIMGILKANKNCSDILITRGDSVFFGLKTKLVVYPDNYFVLWLSVGVRFYKLM